MYFGKDFGVNINSRSAGTEVVIRMPDAVEGDLV